MGWGSATPLFDGAVDVAIEFSMSTHPIITKAVVEKMYSTIEWEDWDTQNESKYYEPYLIEVMHERGELDENYWEWYSAGKPDDDWDWDNKGW